MQNDRGGVYNVAFLMDKTRVTLLKMITSPCSGLTAVVFAVYVEQMLKTELRLQLSISLLD